MVDRHTAEIADAVDQRLTAGGTSAPSITTGHDAGAAVVKLMKQTFDTISPKAIVDEFVAARTRPPRHRRRTLGQVRRRYDRGHRGRFALPCEALGRGLGGWRRRHDDRADDLDAIDEGS